MSLSSLQCTSCSGTEIQRLAVVYESGRTEINTTTRGSTTGVGFAGGGRLGIGTAASSHKTRGTQMTALAERAAPPAKAKTFRWIFLGWLVGIGLSVLTGSFFWLLLALAGAGYMAWRGFTHNRTVWPELKARWDRSWLCHRCGTTFTS